MLLEFDRVEEKNEVRQYRCWKVQSFFTMIGVDRSSDDDALTEQEEKVENKYVDPWHDPTIFRYLKHRLVTEFNQHRGMLIRRHGSYWSLESRNSSCVSSYSRVGLFRNV